MRRYVRKLLACVMVAVLLLPGAIPTTAAPAEDTEWEALQSMLSQYYGEWTDTTYPGLFSNQIPDTALLGNGDIGIASGGDGVSKTFYISKGDFWAYNGSPLPIGGVTLKSAEETAEPVISLAQGKTAVASSSHPSFPANRAVSGQWAMGYEGWVSDVGNPQSLIIDLGAPTTFDRIIIRHDAAARPAETANITRSFKLLAGNTESGVKEIYSTDSNTAAVSDITLDVPVTARYLRVDVLKGTQETTDDSRQNPRARIGQLELYNTAEQDLGDSEPTPSTAFNEKQRIVDATVETHMTLAGGKVSMETYVMPEQNLLITALTSESETALSLAAETWVKVENNRPYSLDMNENRVTVTRRTTGATSSNTAHYISEASLCTEVIGATVEQTTSSSSDRGATRFTLQPGATAYIVTAVAGGGQTRNNRGEYNSESTPLEEATALVKAAPAMLDTAKATHDAWWRDYWLQSYIQLDTTDRNLADIQKYYYAAQYLLGCMIREDTVAPGLYGLWHSTDTPSWNSDYHLNYNFIATFYGVLSSNRPEQARSAIQAILDYMPAAEAAAGSVAELKKVKADFVQMKIDKGDIDPQKGIEGALLYPVGIGPYGMILDTSYHNQTLNAAFSATLLTSYYHYSGDTAFLPTMYDYLKKCARFYEVWLEREGDEYVLYAGYNEGSWAKNSAAELAMLKHVLREAIAAAKELDVDADKREQWQEMLDHLPAQPTAVFGGKEVLALAEQEYSNGTWSAMTNPVPGDGNIIPMESVLPATMLGYYSTDEDLALMQQTIDVFSSRGAWGQNNNFPKIFPIAVRSRYNANTILQKLAEVIRQKTVANLRISDNTHGAEKCGTTQAINEMLLLSDNGVVKLFGNWPVNKSASFTRLRAAGGFVVSAAYDGAAGETTSATITSEKGGSITVAAVWENMKVLDESGEEVAVKLDAAPNHPDEVTYTFETEVGKTYTLVKEEPEGLLGDVDEDGTITSTDARLTLQYYAGKIGEEDLNVNVADVDGDGSITSTDARLILQKYAGKIEDFPI